MDRTRNRKLLVSVFNAQEAREAVLGGARIVDSEDPKSALGNIKPRQIMAISDAVLNFTRDREVHLSTNIGEDQLLFDRSESGMAIEKSPYEIAGKASQAAIGVSCAMGMRVHPCNLVKVGVDGMPVHLVREVLEEVVLTLNRTEQFSHCQVMSVLFAQDLDLWNQRKMHPGVRGVLVGLREFHSMDNPDDETFDLLEADGDYLLNTIRNEAGQFLFTDPRSVMPKKRAEVLQTLQHHGILPENAESTNVKLNEMFPHQKYFTDLNVTGGRTTREVIKAMVDVTADAGADAIMLDTRIQSKTARISLVNTGEVGMIDMNQYDVKDDLPRAGILGLEDLRFFVDYCHFRGVEANLAGSLQSYQAQQVWLKIPEVDQVSTRGGSTAVRRDPFANAEDADTRQHRVTQRNLVRGLVPPEQGGTLNIPDYMTVDPNAKEAISALTEMLNDLRQTQGFPPGEVFRVDRFGNQTPF